MNGLKVKRGDSSDIIEITVDGITDFTNYRGELQILNGDTKETVVNKVTIAPSDLKFLVGLTPNQTAILPVGNYIAVFEIIKEVGSIITFRREISWPVEITVSLINN